MLLRRYRRIVSNALNLYDFHSQQATLDIVSISLDLLIAKLKHLDARPATKGRKSLSHGALGQVCRAFVVQFDYCHIGVVLEMRVVHDELFENDVKLILLLDIVSAIDVGSIVLANEEVIEGRI